MHTCRVALALASLSDGVLHEATGSYVGIVAIEGAHHRSERLASLDANVSDVVVVELQPERRHRREERALLGIEHAQEILVGRYGSVHGGRIDRRYERECQHESQEQERASCWHCWESGSGGSDAEERLY